MFVDNVIFRPASSLDCSARDDKREQNKHGSVCKTHHARVPDLCAPLKEEFCALIHLRTQLVTNWIVNKPFTL
jgi:hypothetical protein